MIMGGSQLVGWLLSWCCAACRFASERRCAAPLTSADVIHFLFLEPPERMYVRDLMVFATDRHQYQVGCGYRLYCMLMYIPFLGRRSSRSLPFMTIRG